MMRITITRLIGWQIANKLLFFVRQDVASLSLFQDNTSVNLALLLGRVFQSPKTFPRNSRSANSPTGYHVYNERTRMLVCKFFH